MKHPHINEYGYTPRSLTRDGAPWFPMMGEFHYSRYPRRHWARELSKMRAGGVSITSSYVIWIHHEEEEGRIRFDGDLDLRGFIQQVGEAGMAFFLRVGPWVHGEVRNGGFPDWLLRKSYEARTNHPDYLADVRRFYTAIFQQVDGLFHYQGGPIIGVQIENEYGHVGGDMDRAEGERHLKNLCDMARDIGYDVPYWTATGWGGALTAGLLPVMGGYPDAPWDPRTTPIEPSTNFVFSPQRNDHAIASDHGEGGELTFDPALYPYLTAELGGGLQVTGHRRPVARGTDIEAMSVVKMGSGASLLGYYMYHGGTNPVGRHTTFEETRDTGYPNDLPALSYDFNAPIREYGQMGEAYPRLRRLALFLEDFGGMLAEMEARFPPDNPEDPANFTALRHAQRDNGEAGFVFVNNYQRLHALAEHPGLRLEAKLPGGGIPFPAHDLEDREYFFWPFNLPMGSAVLKSADAVPLCLLRTPKGEVPVFHADHAPTLEWTVPPQNPPLVLSGADSLLASRVDAADGQHLLLYGGFCGQAENGCRLEGSGPLEFRAWPPLARSPKGFVKAGVKDGFGLYREAGNPVPASVGVSFAPLPAGGGKRWKFIFKYNGKMDGALLSIGAVYNTGQFLVDGEVVADSFFSGQHWELDLERFGYPKEAELRLTPLREDVPLYLESWPPLPGGENCVILSTNATPVRIVTLPI